MIVLSGGIDDYFRFKFIQNRQNHIDRARYRKPSSDVLGRQGNINGCAQSVGAAEIVDKACSRIKCSSILMHGDAQNIRIIPVNILGAVAVMTIRIDNGNSFDAEFMTDIFDHHGFNVDIAEAACAVGDQHGMMAGRTHQGKGIVYLAGQNFLSGGDCASG